MFVRLVIATLIGLPISSVAAESLVKGPELVGGRLLESDYPDAAMARGQEGAIPIKLFVNPDGKVTQCTLVQDANDSTLDDHSCALAMRRFRFLGAVDASGAPIMGVRWMTVKWSLLGDAPEIANDFTLSVRSLPNGQDTMTVPIAIKTNEIGAILACNAQSIKGQLAPPALARAACSALKAAGPVEPARDRGVPVVAVQSIQVGLNAEVFRR